MSIRYKGILCAAAIGAVVVGAGAAEALAGDETAMDAYRDAVNDMGYVAFDPPRTGVKLGDVFLIDKQKSIQIKAGKKKKVKITRLLRLCNLFPNATPAPPDELAPLQVINATKLKDFNFLAKATALTATPIKAGGGFSSTNITEYSADWGKVEFLEIPLFTNEFSDDPAECKTKECRAEATYSADHREAQTCAAKIDAMPNRKDRKNTFVLQAFAYADALNIDFELNPHVKAQAIAEAANNTADAANETETDKVENIAQATPAGDGGEVTQAAAEEPIPMLGTIQLAPVIKDMAKELFRTLLTGSEATVTKAKKAASIDASQPVGAETDHANVSAEPLVTEGQLKNYTAYATARCGKSANFTFNLIKIFGIGGGGRICQTGESRLSFATPYFVGYSPMSISRLRDLGAIYMDAPKIEVTGKLLSRKEFDAIEGAELTDELDEYLKAIGAIVVSEQVTDL